MKKTQQHFTLIEIMTVIVIIGILSAILFPVLGSIRERGKVTETQTLVTGIKTAILTFKTDNGLLPYHSPDGASTDEKIGDWGSISKINSIKPDSNYTKFFDVLTYANHNSAGSSPTSNTKACNPKAQRYLDVPKKYFGDDSVNSVRDSWNRPLIIYLDMDQDGHLKVDTNGYESDELTDAVVLSMGGQDAGAKSYDTSQFISSSK